MYVPTASLRYTPRLNTAGTPTHDGYTQEMGGRALGQGSTFGWDSDPVEIAGELLGHVGLSSRRQADHHDHRWGVGHVGSPRCTEGQASVLREDIA